MGNTDSGLWFLGEETWIAGGVDAGVDTIAF